MELKELIKRATEIRESYKLLEEKKYGRGWTTEEIAMGFVGDVGDLMKLIQSYEGIRNIPDYKEKLAHELADCLWSIIIIANEVNIDLESSFVKTMGDLETSIQQKL